MTLGVYRNHYHSECGDHFTRVPMPNQDILEQRFIDCQFYTTKKKHKVYIHSIEITEI